MFAGGEARQLTPEHDAVKMTLHLVIKVRDIQSFQAGALLSKNCMDAMMMLFTERDGQLNAAHKLVNLKKKGYVERIKSQHIQSEVADLLFQFTSPCFDDPKLVLLAQSLSTNYRTTIPYLKQWPALEGGLAGGGTTD